MMEGIMQVASDAAAARRPIVVGPRDQALRAGRTCYDHLAGRLGVALADALVEQGHVELSDDAGQMTESGLARLVELGIDIDPASAGRRRTRLLCRPCLDWSERRPHLAGVLGAALCRACFDRGWVRRSEAGRAVVVTPKGRRALREAFGVVLD
jgi:hypothetical protein